MQLTKIITLASRGVYFRFLAMERSLRATSCTLPLFVIPYNNDLFELPANAQWLEDRELFAWLDGLGLRGVFRKYHCFFEKDYLFVDSDIIFLRDPQEVMKPYHGFITSCGHWHNTLHTVTDTSRIIMAAKSTIWQSSVFNSGQFASSEQLYDFETLKKLASDPRHQDTCLNNAVHDQPGLNLLVHFSGIEVTNLTLPPINMQSTWAGDYNTNNYTRYWHGKNTPILIHWAGCVGHKPRPLNDLLKRYLDEKEIDGFDKEVHSHTPLGTKIWRRIKKKILSIIK